MGSAIRGCRFADVVNCNTAINETTASIPASAQMSEKRCQNDLETFAQGVNLLARHDRQKR
jgi:hypothetical protein